ncbi:MAG: hypothetical protein KAI24_10465 [Planctomycetes bacterium]|nr:hypothetical protein [Planctomycetota bacterium]
MASTHETKVLEVRIRQLPTVKVPESLGEDVERAAADGWRIDQVVPILAKGLLGGSYTDTLLVFMSRER